MRNVLLIAALALTSASVQAAGLRGMTLAADGDPVALPSPTPGPAATLPPAAAPGQDAPSQSQPALVRHCTTLDGKRFDWHSSNVPFAVLTCS